MIGGQTQTTINTNAHGRSTLPSEFTGRILRVDLATGSKHDESLTEAPVLKKLIGSQALASRILLKELPLDGTTLGRSATSGFWGTYLKAAGHDGAVISGAAKNPCFLYIHEGKAELREAVGNRNAKILCIGSACFMPWKKRRKPTACLDWTGEVPQTQDSVVAHA
jgi:aldehyde:ferredoxin oxidoreductase